MIGFKGGVVRGRTLKEVVSEEDNAVLRRIVARARRAGQASEQAILSRSNAEATDAEPGIPVAIAAAALPGESGVVLVIEDLTELIAAQRASAWKEVAKRMAHEIKNPLTPIQLSAERIAKRFAGSAKNTDAAVEVVRDGTDTIIREVRSLKSMVDEFSRFARLPGARLEQGNLNEIIRHVLVLYDDRVGDIRFETQLGSDIPEFRFDPEQVKRVFVNLIDNALEAFECERAQIPEIYLRTRYDRARSLIVAEVADNGPGVSPSDLGKLFQPYFSTKSRGTGLGLAIVQQIITEHGGAIKAAANNGRGARFTIEFPVIS